MHFMKQAVTLARLQIELDRMAIAECSYLFDEARCWINHSRRTNGNEEIALGQCRIDFRHEVRHLPEPNDVHAQLAALITTRAAASCVEIVWPFMNIRTRQASRLQQLPVHV